MHDNQLFWRALLWMRSLVLLTILISLNPIIAEGSPVESGQLPQSPQLERNIVVHQKLEGPDRRIELRYNRVSSIWSGIGKLTVFAEEVDVVVEGAFDREGLKLRVRGPNFRIGSWGVSFVRVPINIFANGSAKVSVYVQPAKSTLLQHLILRSGLPVPEPLFIDINGLISFKPTIHI